MLNWHAGGLYVDRFDMGRRRALGAAGYFMVAVALVAGCEQQHAGPPPSSPSAPAGSSVASVRAPSVSSPVTTAATTAADDAPPTSGAAALLARLPVKGRAPKTGYAREQFGPAWTDDNDDPDGHNGCDTRNDILRRDLVATTLKAGTHGCIVLTGTLHDPYTGRTIAFTRGASTSIAVQIDHVVALSDAWQKGAQQLTREQRIDLANDPLNLLAVDGPANESKSDGDAATWLPPNKAYRCAYVARQVAVKTNYHLWVTAAERDAIFRVLRTCASQTVPKQTRGTPAAGR